MIGEAARRSVGELAWPVWTVKAGASDEPSASCPSDLVALPPDCVQSVFVTGAGRLICSAAVAGSTLTSPSPVKTAIRCPRTGVLVCLPFLKAPQLVAAKAMAIRRVTWKYFGLVILGPTGPGSRAQRRHRRRANLRLGLLGRG